jgi:short-subunit dehydrogenase
MAMADIRAFGSLCLNGQAIILILLPLATFQQEPAMADGKQRPRALVTGASSGIGLAFAERLAADAYDLVLVARRRERLEQLAASLRGGGGAVDILAADLADPAGLKSVEARLAADQRVELLVNNAGFGAYGAFLEADPDVLERQIALHATATARLARAALPGMIARGKGGVINVASTFAFSSGVKMPARKRANYVATKAYIVALTELLAHELEGSGVAVQALCPGVVRTEFHEAAGGRPPGVHVFEPTEVVAASLAALKLGEAICIPHLADASALDRLAEARNALWEQARSSAIAPRYRA